MAGKVLNKLFFFNFLATYMADLCAKSASEAGKVLLNKFFF